jgi:hypothetical protein
LATFFTFITRRFLRLVLRFAFFMVRLFLDFLVVRFFAAFFAVFFLVDVWIGAGRAGGGLDGGVIGEGLNSPDMLSPVGSFGLMPNMPTIGLVLSVLDILASESSGQHRNISQPWKNCQQKIYMWGVKLSLTTTH